MNVISTVVKKNLSIDEDTKVTGIINGNVNVMPGVALQMKGILNGSLTISEEGYAKINGIVNGKINNYGSMDFYGIVDREINNISGKMVIHKDAIVNGEKY